MEYKIITGTAPDCQKWLNQWKHEFDLELIQMCVDKACNDDITILLIRRKK